jgi:muramidase (phage lysozyme)
MRQNLAAFLRLIIHSEGSDQYPDPYSVTYGCNVTKFFIRDFSNHPAILGWYGVPLDHLGSRYVGKYSTAAGAYQITKPTWLDIGRAIHLKDFSKESQDSACIWLIQCRARALNLINGGNVQEAIVACSRIWASLPGSSSGQPQAKMANLIQFYTENGGGFA